MEVIIRDLDEEGKGGFVLSLKTSVVPEGGVPPLDPAELNVEVLTALLERAPEQVSIKLVDTSQLLPVSEEIGK